MASFIGLLVLPKPSQNAVLQNDGAIINDENRDNLVAAIRALADFQNDEVSRHSAVQLIFHPIPAVSLRTWTSTNDTG